MAGRTSGRGRQRTGFGDVVLIHGPEAYLADRAVADAVADLRAATPDVEVTEVPGAELDAGRLAELTGPSLFADRRALVVEGLEDVVADLFDRVTAYASAPEDDIGVVLVHRGGNKGKRLLDALKKLDGVRAVACVAPKNFELPGFVVGEVRGAGGQIDDNAAADLVDAVGHDLRALAGAASQLVADCDGRVTAEDIHRYFGGRAEVTSFAVADAALAGRRDQSLERLRWALADGVAAVLVTSAMASGLRGLARYISAPRGLREGDLAREVGVPPWKLKSLRSQARGWSPSGLATAIRAVARADADVKGAAEDADYSLERMVLSVIGAHDSSR